MSHDQEQHPSDRQAPAGPSGSRRLRRIYAYGLGLAVVLAACTGKIGGPLSTGVGPVTSNGAAPQGTSGSAATSPGPTIGPDGAVVPAACNSLTSRRVRRLSLREYSNVVNTLLGATAQQEVVAAWPSEPTVEGFDDQDSALFVSSSLQETIADIAQQLASEADPTTLAPCSTTAGSTACLQSFITSFTMQAYGRPLTSDENSALLTLAALGQDYPTSVRLVIEDVLQNPNMLYVYELGTAAASTAPVLLTPYEIASQLSFLLTGSRPDATLLQVAQSTSFTNPSDIQTQAQRLVVTAAGQASLARFVTGWMDMGPIATVPKDPTVYPAFTPAVAAAMQQEFDQFVTTQLKGGNGTLVDFMTATSTNIPAALSAIYGSDLLASGQLDPTHRKGLLSLPAVLTYNSNDINSGPVERGLLVRRQLLCQIVGPPPAAALAVIAANPFTLDAGLTTRQFFENHTTNPACSGCHNQFDPIGFGMEDMDGLGRFRTTDNGLPVDSSGQLTGSDVDGTFTGPAELSVMLSQSQDIASCMVSRYFNFDQARDPATADQCVLQNWSAELASGGGHIIDLVNASVADNTFIYREDDR